MQISVAVKDEFLSLLNLIKHISTQILIHRAVIGATFEVE